MTPAELRVWERFAAASLQGMRANEKWIDARGDVTASWAADDADAMLAEWRKRAKKEGEGER